MSDAASNSNKPQIEVVSDDDWKERVKAADAKLDAERQAQHAASESPPEGLAGKVPPASFASLVQMLSTQAIVALGLIPAPDGKVLRELELSKHFIDQLSLLEEKCKGNLTAQESRLLDNTLHELRMAFIEVSRQAGTGHA